MKRRNPIIGKSSWRRMILTLRQRTGAKEARTKRQRISRLKEMIFRNNVSGIRGTSEAGDAPGDDDGDETEDETAEPPTKRGKY
jgi:hypothetical protein